MLYEHEMVLRGLARWHNGRLIPIMRGADGRDDTPELPEDLAALDAEALQALHDEFQTAGRTLLAAAKARDADVLGDRTQVDVEEELAKIGGALTAIRTEQESREADDETFDAKLGEFEQTLGQEDAAADEKGDDETSDDEGDEKGDEDEPEAETASAATRPTTRRPIPLASRRHKPVQLETDERGFRAQVRAEPLSVGYGDQLDERAIGELLHHVVRRGVASPGTKLTVATATFPFPDDRNVGSRDGKQSIDPRDPRIAKALDERNALVASGAICAPPEPIYDVPNVSVAERPVRAALTSFQANRGSVIVRGGIQMGDYEDAVGHITAADNADGGSLAVKNCMRIECPDTTTVVIDSIFQCIEADNLAARSDPELMAAIDAQVRAEQARLADGFLLDRIKTLSNAVTGASAGAGGVVYHLLADAAKEAAGYRSAHRMSRGATLQALLPDWIIDAVTLDYMRAAFNTGDPANRAAAEADLRSKFAAFGINVSFFLDGSSNPTNGQVFAHWVNSTLVGFPATVEWFLFAPNTFTHLDAGSLDLGIVRDSNLNATNDFQVFAETWENVAKIGVESRVITSNVCPNGTFAAGNDLHATC